MTEQEVIHTAAVRAAVVFGREGWTWAGHPDPPSVADIEAEYTRLVERVNDERVIQVQFGRLCVDRDRDDGVVTLSVKTGTILPFYCR